jgi:hypothetical protein
MPSAIAAVAGPFFDYSLPGPLAWEQGRRQETWPWELT